MTKGYMFDIEGLCLLSEFAMRMQVSQLGHEEIVGLFNELYNRMVIFQALNGCGYSDTVEFFIQTEKLLEGEFSW